MTSLLLVVVTQLLQKFLPFSFLNLIQIDLSGNDSLFSFWVSQNYYYYRSWPRLTLKYHLGFNSKILLCAVGEPGMSSNKIMLFIHCWWGLHCEWRLQAWWWRCPEVFRLLNQLKLFASYLIGVRDVWFIKYSYEFFATSPIDRWSFISLSPWIWPGFIGVFDQFQCGESDILRLPRIGHKTCSFHLGLSNAYSGRKPAAM